MDAVTEAFWAIIFCAPVAQLAEATDSKPVQCEFKSHLGTYYPPLLPAFVLLNWGERSHNE